MAYAQATHPGGADDLAARRIAGLAPQVLPAAAAEAPPAVSWGAVLAGAAGAAALSLILLILGTGFGLSVVSPWAQDGVRAATFGAGAIAWITLTQVAASALGGYLAGRLRSRWTDTQRDEVYFRDTAHGFLAWAVSSLAAAALLGSAIGGIVGAGGKAVAGGAAAAAAAGPQEMRPPEMLQYHVDSLFRRDPATAATTPAPTDPAPLPEAVRIFANDAGSATLPPEDARYLGQLVAQRTGLSQVDAEKRVADTWARLQQKTAQAREAADTARKTAAWGSLWLFVSLLAGAFVASLAATWGGRQRDL